MATLNLTNITANLGAYCRENNNEIFMDTMLGMTDILERGGIMTWDGVKDEEPLVNLSFGDIVKPRNIATFAPSDDAINADSRMLKTRGYKVDLEIFPLQFEKTYLAWYAKQKRTIKDWVDVPLEQYMMQGILMKVQENLRKATFRGEYDANGTSFLDICDGFVTLMKADVAANKIPTVALGAVNPANVIQKTDLMAQELSDEYANQLVYMHVSRKVWDMYITADPTSVGRVMNMTDVPGMSPANRQDVYLRIGNIKLVRNIDLVHTDDATEIFCTIDNNLIVGTNTESDMNQIEFQKFNRGIKMLMDGSWGVNYALANNTKKPIICSDAFVAV
jgi:hypothetical protein